VHRQLRGIASDKAIGLGPNKVLSVPDAIGIALEKWMREKQGVQQDLLGGAPSAPSPVEIVQPNASPVNSSDAPKAQYGFDALNRSESFIGTCPDCGSSLEFAEGCAKCHVCGFSECG
jgi:ribonucleoside-diphosphate reductase alpha chain